MGFVLSFLRKLLSLNIRAVSLVEKGCNLDMFLLQSGPRLRGSFGASGSTGSTGAIGQMSVCVLTVQTVLPVGSPS